MAYPPAGWQQPGPYAQPVYPPAASAYPPAYPPTMGAPQPVGYPRAAPMLGVPPAFGMPQFDASQLNAMPEGLAQTSDSVYVSSSSRKMVAVIAAIFIAIGVLFIILGAAQLPIFCDNRFPKCTVKTSASWWQTLLCSLFAVVGVLMLVGVKSFRTEFDDHRKVLSVQNCPMIMAPCAGSKMTEISYFDVAFAEFRCSGTTTTSVGFAAASSATWELSIKTRDGTAYNAATFDAPAMMQQAAVMRWRNFLSKRCPTCVVHDPGFFQQMMGAKRVDGGGLINGYS